jgi:hypothetical protein
MNARLAPALWTCAALLSGLALAQPQVTVLERQSFSGEELGAPEAATHRMRLAIVILEGSGWTRGRAVASLLEASTILAQCGIALERVEFHVLEVPAGSMDFSTPAARELAVAYPLGRPAVWLVRDTRSRPAFDAEAIGRGNSRTRPEIADTVWITAAARDPGVVFAHELAHVLMDSGEHSEDAGNLMREETSARNRSLSAAQCARLGETGKANGLLR